MTISANTLILLELSFLKGVGPAALKRIVDGTDLSTFSLEEQASRHPVIQSAIEEPSAWDTAKSSAARQVETANKYGARIISALDDEYPQLLKGTKDDPYILFVQGKFSVDPEKAIAVIGTREPTPHGVQITERVTRYLVENGQSIISGLAFGCDAIAHRTALACKGHTVAVLAHGLHTTSPGAHKQLAKDILANGGALVSEYRFGQGVQNPQYVKRDKTQAGMAHSVVMVQSDLVGGSLHASRAAIAYSRRLAVPRPTARDQAFGEAKIRANLLLSEGSDEDKAKLLKCKVSDLASLVILENKHDYVRLLNPHDSTAPYHYSTEVTENQLFETKADIFSDEEGFVAPKDLLMARQKFIGFKLKELEALADSLADGCAASRFEAQFELENLFNQTVSLLSDLEIFLKAKKMESSDLSNAANGFDAVLKKFRQERSRRDIPAFGTSNNKTALSWGIAALSEFKVALNNFTSHFSAVI